MPTLVDDASQKEETMKATRVMRAGGAAGVLASILILGGLYLVTTGQPGNAADAGAWTAYAQREEFALESGVYYLLVPGLLLFLAMFAALVGLLPRDAVSAASTFGFYQAFEDPTAMTVFTGASAGYHLQEMGVWSLAMTMVASAVGLRSSAAISMPWYGASIVLAVLAVAGTLAGFGVILCLVWILAAGIGLLRWTPSPGAAAA
jgi:SpoU rRNA methylase family enzyme